MNTSNLPTAAWLGTAAVAGAVIGSIGPWATAPFGLEKSGLDGGSDGWITLVAAGLAGSSLINVRNHIKGSSLAMIICGALILIVGIADINDVESRGNANLLGREVDVIQVGWGLWLVTISGVVLAFAGLLLRREPAQPDPGPTAED